MQISNPDQLVLSALIERGTDIHKDHHIDFFIYYPNEQSAVDADKKIREVFPYLVPKIRQALNSDEWIIEYNASLVPEIEILKKLRSVFENTGGDYDGWGAEIVR